jgi:asparagine synthase (glutamine-hydrolysing)
MRRSFTYASLVAAWGDDDQRAFDELAADVPIPHKAVDSWRDETERISIGWAPCSGASEPPNETKGSLLSLENCVVAFDGRLHTETDDVPAVIEAYRRWGLDCSAHLRGDFSFILWDLGQRRLLAASDPSGKRSLAYFFDNRSLGIASRVLTLLRHPRIRRRYNATYFAHILGNFWSMPPGITAFGQIRRIRPRHALILEDGRLSEARVGRPSGTATPNPSSAKLHEEFWQIMNDATRERLDGHSATCLSLSGGIDSSIVAATMASQVSECQAFTLVSKGGTDPGELSAIQSLCKRYPNIRSFTVPIDDAPVWANVDPALPLTDDPVIDGDSLRRARFRLANVMSQHGFQLAFDGVGGDELFGMNRRINDLVTDRSWLALARTLAASRNRRSLLWHLIAPRLPVQLRSAWMRRERRTAHFRPPWLTRAFLTAPETVEARENAEAWELIDSSSEAFTRVLEDPVNVGSRIAFRLTAAAAGVWLLSPMLDARLIEFAIALSAKVNWGTTQSKPFLRDAARSRLPAAVLDRDKDVALDGFLRNQALRSQTDWPALRALLESTEILRDQVDFGIVSDHLGRLRGGHSVPEMVADAGYDLIAISKWAHKVERAYGVLT